MTIKQLGGVFGRNPTFNDVTIEGQLTFDGDIDINSDLTVDGEVTADGVNISQLTGATLKIESTGAGLGAGSSIGKIDFFGNDASAPGPGVKASIEALTEASLGDDGALVFRTSSGTANNIETARLRAGVGLVLPSGSGIDFSATAGTGTSELLSDYEEGVWTPTITDLTNAVTATSQGTYTKVGRHVICSFRVTASSLGSASGAIYISGLPFTVLNSNGARCSGAIGFTQNLNLSAAGQTVTIFPTNNQVYAALNVWDATTGTTNMQASELSATGALYGSLEYFV